MSASVETPTKTLLVALGVSLVCSIVVAAAAVGLRPRQAENELRFQQRNILAAAGLYDPGRDVGEQFGQIEVRIVDLATGEYIEDLDPDDYDALLRTHGFKVVDYRPEDPECDYHTVWLARYTS